MSSFRSLDDLLSKRRGLVPPPVRHPVVLIDDDPAIRDSLTFLLGDRYELTACASAMQGVAAVNEDTCAVILDVKMPGQDGFWACAEIRRKSPSIPVIFYSAYQDLKDPYTIINEHRPFGYINKGDDVQKLVDMLGVAVQLQAMVISNDKLLRSLQSARSRVR